MKTAFARTAACHNFEKLEIFSLSELTVSLSARFAGHPNSPPVTSYYEFVTKPGKSRAISKRQRLPGIPFTHIQ
ncbi:hypothetical protein OS493_010149 [Desmophyllum pertusum]|uniref:Uncharacterized protein n=1 Tax=Desmophyllum pertusum TaxID=174260 RepID=A0A9W9YHZ7_9CNID|nr:hypothetical protein OS493_010149 [Desmophyllum pertusum]